MIFTNASFAARWRRVVAGVLLLLQGLALSGCDSGTEWSSGKYAVYWIDLRENLVPGRKLDGGNFIGRVAAPVIAVGDDEKWVVAARRGPKGERLFYYFLKSRDDDFKTGLAGAASFLTDRHDTGAGLLEI